jgi:hypothetical protein
MALIEQRAGCKVAWATYDNEAEALAASEQAKKDAVRRAELGFDFGYCVPGEINHRPDHPEHGEVWVVTLP